MSDLQARAAAGAAYQAVIKACKKAAHDVAAILQEHGHIVDLEDILECAERWEMAARYIESIIPADVLSALTEHTKLAVDAAIEAAAERVKAAMDTDGYKAIEKEDIERVILSALNPDARPIEMKAKPRTCPTCNAPLVRKQFSGGRMEDWTVFNKRKHCNRACTALSRRTGKIKNQWTVEPKQATTDATRNRDMRKEGSK